MKVEMMNKTHGSRKRDIEMFVKLALLKNDLQRVAYLRDMYKLSDSDISKCVKEVRFVTDS